MLTIDWVRLMSEHKSIIPKFRQRSMILSTTGIVDAVEHSDNPIVPDLVYVTVKSLFGAPTQLCISADYCNDRLSVGDYIIYEVYQKNGKYTHQVRLTQPPDITEVELKIDELIRQLGQNIRIVD